MTSYYEIREWQSEVNVTYGVRVLVGPCEPDDYDEVVISIIPNSGEGTTIKETGFNAARAAAEAWLQEQHSRG